MINYSQLMSKLPSDPLIIQYETFLNEKLRGDLESPGTTAGL